jgi:phosphate transport system permease protein
MNLPNGMTSATDYPSQLNTPKMQTQESINMSLYASRKRTNLIGLFLSMSAMTIGLTFLLWILAILFFKGFSAFSLDLFLNKTPGPDSENGGLGNAIIGSLMIVVSCTLISTPIGVMAGIYLSEYGQKSKFSEITRFLNDIMLSAPSIVIGLFVYALVVVNAKHFSGWAGVMALALLQVPIVIRTTENMLKLVPDGLREAAYALGTPKWRIISAITLKASISGIITGVLFMSGLTAGACDKPRTGTAPMAHETETLPVPRQPTRQYQV